MRRGRSRWLLYIGQIWVISLRVFTASVWLEGVSVYSQILLELHYFFFFLAPEAPLEGSELENQL